MRILPISLLEPTLANIRGLRLRLIRRHGTLLAGCKPGDRLWVREPFHLPEAFDHHSPVEALAKFATIWFAIDGAAPGGYGRRRFARELPRDAHRMYLRLTAVRTEQLQAIDDADIAAHGFRDRTAFAADWNRQTAPAATISGARLRWADDPPVTVLAFDPVFQPIATADFASRTRAPA